MWGRVQLILPCWQPHCLLGFLLIWISTFTSTPSGHSVCCIVKLQSTLKHTALPHLKNFGFYSQLVHQFYSSGFIELAAVVRDVWGFTLLFSFADAQTRATFKSQLPVKSKEVDVSRPHLGASENDVTKIIKPRRENGWESEHRYPNRTSG